MKIKIYTIAKKQNLHNLSEIQQEIRQFGASMEIIYKFNKDIEKAQKISPQHAKTSYTREFEKYISKDDANIALHPSGEELDSYHFSNILKDRNIVNFFIGGAYGFEETFLCQTRAISLSKLTFSHKIAQIVLCEQIFRALCIINNHPYHKE